MRCFDNSEVAISGDDNSSKQSVLYVAMSVKAELCTTTPDTSPFCLTSNYA